MSGSTEVLAYDVLIADDEELARTRVAELLAAHPSARVIGQTGSGLETLEAIRSRDPDLVFLDVQMPRLTGFEVLDRLDVSEYPFVIFCTAYDEYAIEAFEVNAIDYLLKPYSDERFQESLRRAEAALRGRRSQRSREELRTLLESVRLEASDELGSTGGRYLERFAVPARGRWVVTPVEAVDWIEASGDYVTLHVGERTHLLRGTMSAIERRLDPRRFIRIHRSTIVQSNRVRGIETGEHGEYMLQLDSGARLRVSRSYRDEVLGRLGVRL